MVALVQEIVEILVSGITGLASGIGSGLNAMVKAAFLTDTGSLSTFGGVVAVFAAISLAVGLTTLVTRYILSFGGRN